MKQELHVVLGGSGAIGTAVIKALQEKGKSVRAVERKKQVKGVETVFADLLNLQDCQKSIKGATHVYLCVGLPYSSKIWLKDWPRLMQVVIEACSLEDAKLIFLDNIYMYGPAPLQVPITEEHPQDTTTKKGIARKKTANLLIEAIESKKIKALIGRSADFYGPNAVNSNLYIKFIENILKNQNPQFLGKKGFKHTFSYSLDNGRALVELALDESAYGEVWHLPVGKPITIDEVVEIINKILNSNFKVSYLPRPLLNLISLMIPIIKEAKEMIYQFDSEYLLSDRKFFNKFPNFKVTEYETGLNEMLESFKK